jgi:oligopeptide transport system permease protein
MSDSSPSLPSSRPHELERYAALLRETEHLRGKSPARIAWQRLRKRWPAMVALTFLVLLGLLAIFTPLLPLQAPRAVDLPRAYQPPEFFNANGSIWSESRFIPSTIRVSAENTTNPDLELLHSGFGYDDLNWFSQWLLTSRVRLFGAWTWNSWCGTDNLGRDLLSRICWGTRLSIKVALVATFVSLVIGVTYGAVAGFLGGRIDNAMMRFVDVLYSIPFIFIVIFLMTLLDNEQYKQRLAIIGIDQMTIFYLLIGALFWITMSRVVRGQVLALKHQQFVEAARSLGAGNWWIIRKHLIPNLLSIVIVYLTLTIPNVILVEAFLSFLGLGVRPPDVSWGILANEGRLVITPVIIYWWLVVFPGLAIALTLYSLNFLGDGLRDAMDPRLRNR